MTFAWLELRTHCHATEDEEKVSLALQFLCPGVKPSSTKTEGFHRNPIIVLAARTDNAKSIREFWRLLHGENLVGSILGLGGKAIDKDSVLHFRLDKQEAYLGKAVLAGDEDAIVVRVKVIRYPSAKGDVMSTARESIMELTQRHVPDT